MKIRNIPATVLVSVTLVHASLSAPARIPGGKADALDQKILGAWTGQIACEGRFLFRSNGTYELTGYGPAGVDSSGTWKLRGDGLPATLLLTCTASEVPEEIDSSRAMTISRLDEESLVIGHGNDSLARYNRPKK